MKIINIVASGDLHQPIPFERLPELPDTNYRYNPENYHGAYILLSRGKATSRLSAVSVLARNFSHIPLAKSEYHGQADKVSRPRTRTIW